ncbi:Indole-3-acetic acid-amido synthetase GH3.3 [Quillaja saponaria]|uniref:Indole-3-acetic acid-amido synthetase GH3.3 n=1 Tax=Quillaja saponaria TaxID=32244 RepID=A0AAD7QHF6_QUISA|nr:Indole-3-acetic acid-amido synthetase GH3.3 [Quillaja saponaria]
MRPTLNVVLSEKRESFDENNNKVADYNKKALNFIEEVTSKADEIQNQVLSEILTQNAKVEYLQRHGLDGCTDRETFKKMIPVVDYENIKPDIDRIANGDTSPILCYKPISEFFTSSATSGGECKLIPMTEDAVQRTLLFFSLLRPVMDQFIPGLDKGKGIKFSFIRKETRTPGGLVARPATTSILKSQNLIRDRTYDPYANYRTSPMEVILCSDWYQSMYTQLLCGLCQNMQVILLGATFASGIVYAMKFLENHWVLLCNDIRKGELDPKITDPSVRGAVMKILKPNPILADLIEAECAKGNCLPLASPIYVSSECHFALNLNPLCKPNDISYTFIPTMGYFEFLPVNREDTNFISKPRASLSNKESLELIDLVDVKLGQEYEVVVTTYAGLYRYRIGDILLVTGFTNKTPQFSYVCRKNVVLSIDADKTDEVELQNALKNAANNLLQFDATLKEYTSYADMSSIPGHYVLYWEINLRGQIPIHPYVIQDCCIVVEESLSSVYKTLRVVDKSIGPLEIKVVESGTFDKLMGYVLSKGASASQYKTPRCVKHASIIELLNSNVVSNHFSPTCPKWVSYS